MMMEEPMTAEMLMTSEEGMKTAGTIGGGP